MSQIMGCALHDMAQSRKTNTGEEMKFLANKIDDIKVKTDKLTK